MILGLTQPQKLAHDVRIFQVHVSKSPMHYSINVRLSPTPSPPFTPNTQTTCDWEPKVGINLALILCKDMAPALTQSQNLDHESRISQVHINRPPVHFPTNVGHLPILSPPSSHLSPIGAWIERQNSDEDNSDAM